MNNTYEVWNNNACDYDFDEMKHDLEEANEREFSDDAVWSSIIDMIMEDRSNVVSMMSDVRYGAVIIHGTLGRWNGNFDAYKIVNDRHDGFLYSADWEDIINSVNDDSVRFYIDTTTMDLCVDTANHDAGSSFIVSRLNTDAEDFDDDYDKFCWGNMEVDEFIEKYAKPIGADWLKAIGVIGKEN